MSQQLYNPVGANEDDDDDDEVGNYDDQANIRCVISCCVKFLLLKVLIYFIIRINAPVNEANNMYNEFQEPLLNISDD